MRIIVAKLLLLLVLVLMLVLGLVLGAPSADARPGAGPTMLEPSASADPRARAGKHPPKPNIGRPAAGQGARSNSWSHRPGYAAPWSEPSARAPAPAARGGPSAAAGAGQGSFTAFYFWILIGFALVVLVSWGIGLARNREDDAWTSGTTTGWSAPTRAEAERGSEP